MIHGTVISLDHYKRCGIVATTDKYFKFSFDVVTINYFDGIPELGDEVNISIDSNNKVTTLTVTKYAN